MYRIERYTVAHKERWDAVVRQSKNGTFLFCRDFMEYHSDRFEDYSLIIYQGQVPFAVLPAHISGDRLSSHAGLTYGGLVYGSAIKLAEVLKLFRQVLEFLQQHGIKSLYLKMIPSIYHKFPAQELDYVLFLANANLVRRDSLAVIDQRNTLPFSKDRRQCIRRGLAAGLEISEEPKFKEFWEQLLEPNSMKKHGVKPVHTWQEMELLHMRFPQNIRHFNVYHMGKLVAGTTVFVTDAVAHPQYIAGQQDKNRLGSLDFLYNYLINEVFKDKNYFDFGISNEEQGRKLNEGLVFWKESYGARTIVQDFYEVPTANAPLLDNVLL